MGLGWGNLAGGIGEILGKVSTYIPGRIEKLKNEKFRLEEETRKIAILNMDINSAEDRKKAQRLSDCRNRIIAINKLLESSSKD